MKNVKSVKRSLFGIGARCCVEYCAEYKEIVTCSFKEPLLTKPKGPPPRPRPRPKYTPLFIPVFETKEGTPCFKCGRLIDQFEAILYSPPKNNTITKYHLCDKCFKSIIIYKKPKQKPVQHKHRRFVDD